MIIRFFECPIQKNELSLSTHWRRSTVFYGARFSAKPDGHSLIIKVRNTLNSDHQIDEFLLFNSSQASVINLPYYYILYVQRN